MSTYNRLDFQTLGSQPVMSKNLLDRYFETSGSRKHFKYVYNELMDILCDIEWNKGPCSLPCSHDINKW